MNFPFRQLIPYTYVAVKFLKALIHRFPTAYATCEYLKLNIHLYRAGIGTETSVWMAAFSNRSSRRFEVMK